MPTYAVSTCDAADALLTCHDKKNLQAIPSVRPVFSAQAAIGRGKRDPS